MPSEIAVIEVKQQKNKFQNLDSEVFGSDLIKDRETLRWLLAVAKDYASQIDNMLADAIKLGSFKNTIYLVDVDVLRNYLEEGVENKAEQVYVNSLFKDLRTPFAIPEGAFNEFLNWLKKQQLVQNKINDRYLGENKGILTLAKILGIDTNDLYDFDELAGEIAENIDRRTVILTKLISVFESPRFIGVVSDYHKVDGEKIKHVLELLPRNKKELSNRRYLDENDGINLAISIRSHREALLGRGDKPVYYLITQTNIILKLFDKLRELAIDEPAVNETIDLLQKLVGGEKNYDLPVIHPRDLVNAENLIYISPGEKHVKKMWIWRKVFNQLKENIEGNLLPEELQVAKKDLGSINFLESLRAVAELVFDSKDKTLMQLEEMRAKSISVDFARMQQTSRLILPEDVLKEKTTGLVKLLHRAQNVISESFNLGYEAWLDDSPRRLNMSKFRIVQKMEPYPPTEIVSGSLVHSSTANSFSHFEVRWPIYCDNATFVDGLKAVLKVSRPQRSSNTEMLKLRCLKSEEESLWDEGLMVYSLGEVFVDNLHFLRNDGNSFDQINLRRLVRQIHEIQKNEKVFGELSDLSKIEIQQYRLNTKYIDIIYDVIPIEFQDFRYLTILSNFNVSQQIAALFDRTSNMYSDHERLSQAIDSLLSGKFETINF